jgi:hypothetical protein
MPAALFEDSAPSASLDHLKAPLLRTPERRLSGSEARRGPRSSPQAAPKLRSSPCPQQAGRRARLGAAARLVQVVRAALRQPGDPSPGLPHISLGPPPCPPPSCRSSPPASLICPQLPLPTLLLFYDAMLIPSAAAAAVPPSPRGGRGTATRGRKSKHGHWDPAPAAAAVAPSGSAGGGPSNSAPHLQLGLALLEGCHAETPRSRGIRAAPPVQRHRPLRPPAASEGPGRSCVPPRAA